MVQSLSHVLLFVTPLTAACQASLSITNFWSLLKHMSIESVMPSNHLILRRPFLLLSSICPSIRVFSNESVLHIKWPKYWSFSFSISPSSEYSGLISFRLQVRVFNSSWGLPGGGSHAHQRHVLVGMFQAASVISAPPPPEEVVCTSLGMGG